MRIDFVSILPLLNWQFKCLAMPSFIPFEIRPMGQMTNNGPRRCLQAVQHMDLIYDEVQERAAIANAEPVLVLSPLV
jgi:hypothetical protein